jgi:hypothetical protein
MINLLPSASPPLSLQYSLEILKEEARQLVDQRILSRHQPIYRLCEFIPPREWIALTAELEAWNFLLRDRIGDLLGVEKWCND